LASLRVNQLSFKVNSTMIDYVRITARAGNGGAGVASFLRGRGGRLGRANGGDGGAGGDVYIEATNDLNTLEPYRYVKDCRAGNGKPGASNFRKGAGGEGLVLKVPVGTEVRLSVFGFQLSDNSQSVSQLVSQVTKGQRDKVGEGMQGLKTERPKTGQLNSENRQQITDNRISIYDLVEHGQQVLIARGGDGGRGNAKLRDEFGRRPRAGESGGVGEACQLTLELKLIADVGLIGLPNAGKSTLLAALTAARPAIADYPFTTLEPNLGVLDSSQFSVDSSQAEQTVATVNREPRTDNRPALLVIADIPGLIAGASAGRGLGDLFLRHIERTRVLVHLIDSSQFTVHSSQTEQTAATVNREPRTENQLSVNRELTAVNSLWKNYQTIRNELKAYSEELAKKREIIVLTKIDLVSLSVVEAAIALFAKYRKKVMAISAKTGEGLAKLIEVLLSNCRF
jgi:GTPase